LDDRRFPFALNHRDGHTYAVWSYVSVVFIVIRQPANLVSSKHVFSKVATDSAHGYPVCVSKFELRMPAPGLNCTLRMPTRRVIHFRLNDDGCFPELSETRTYFK
jgi:hypothetical protein